MVKSYILISFIMMLVTIQCGYSELNETKTNEILSANTTNDDILHTMIIDNLTNREYGLKEIKHEVKGIENTVNNPDYGVQEIFDLLNQTAVNNSNDHNGCSIIEGWITGCEISNNYTLMTEVVIAVFAILISYAFYLREKSGRESSDKLITKQSGILERQEQLRNKRMIAGLENVHTYIMSVMNSLDSINRILDDSTDENKFRERLQKYLEESTSTLNKLLSVTYIGPPEFVDKEHQLWVLTKGWVQGLGAVLDYIKGDIDSDLYIRLANFKSKVEFSYNFELGVSYIMNIAYQERAFIRVDAVELLKLIQEHLELLKKPEE